MYGLPLAQHLPGMAHSVIALTGAGFQQERSTVEGESDVGKNAFGQQRWAGGSNEMMEKCTERIVSLLSSKQHFIK